jgi:DNA-binding FadR family transcriptional regulator
VGRGTFLRAAAADALAAAGRGDPDAGAADSGQEDGDVLGGGGEPPRSAVRPAAPDFAPADVMTIRRLIEPQALPLVVLWATARDFAEMERCVTGGDEAASYEEFETWDLALHRGIIAAAHSPLLVALYGVVESARHGQVWGDLKRRSATRQRRELYQEDHRSVVAALRARDSDTAVEAMRAHLARVAGHLLGETH